MLVLGMTNNFPIDDTVGGNWRRAAPTQSGLARNPSRRPRITNVDPVLPPPPGTPRRYG